MDRRTLVEFVVGWILVLIGGLIMVLPLFNIISVKKVFILVISLYSIIHLIKNFLILESKEYSGFSTSLACVAVLIILLFKDINDNPLNLALILFIWIILMSLIKLKESDYYHDYNVIFTGILTTVNLYCTPDIQILVLGFFFLVNGILDLMDPLVAYVINKQSMSNKKEKN